MIHFSLEELAARRKAAAQELAARGLDGLLMFRQESMYYLTGYDTFGYVFFQCLYMGADGETLTLLTRTPDVRQAEHTSVVEDIRVWYDTEGADPAGDLREILEEHGCKGKRLGIETDAYGLTGYNLKRVEAALGSFCELVEASDLVSRLRVIKSPAEIAYVREAARLADLGLDRAVEVAAPGVFGAMPTGAARCGGTRKPSLRRVRVHLWATTFSPNWMDWPMLFSGNPVPAEPGMVFFLHCVVADSGRGVAMSLGRTCLVTRSGREILSARPLDLIVV